jgi:peptidoglycan/LPS O-acetylase OafA/YrhL
VYLPDVYSLSGASLLIIPFIIFASGNPLFGLLTCRPARFLGLLSYSVYLLHNWLLFVISRFVNHYTEVRLMSESWYWLLGTCVALGTVCLATFSYRYVEAPYIGSTSKARPSVRSAPPHWLAQAHALAKRIASITYDHIRTDIQR